MAYRGRVFVVVIIIVLLLTNLSLVPFRAAALSFQYDFSIRGVLEKANLLYLNDSFADGDRISLTKMTTQSAGRVAYAQPVRLWDCRTGSVASFSTSFSFAIGGNHNSTRGDGITFLVGPFPPTLPQNSTNQYLGLYTNPNILGSPPTVAVEFDTFWNSELDPPNVTDHVGIDINSLHSINYTTDVPNLGLYGRMSANITYDAGSKMMAVSLQLADGSNHHIQTLVDLIAAGLPQDAGVGFSASTGAFWESHQLLSWSFNSTDMADVPLTDPPCKTGLLLRICMIVQAALLAFLAAALLYICMCRWIKRRKRRGFPLQVAREFSYKKLSAATNSFSEKKQLGKGTFGEVYRGDLPGQLKVAVKKLTTLQLPRTRRDYANEIMILGQLYHRNLVKLVGWCDGGYSSNRLLLVYELMAKGSVDMYLHGSRRLLTWPERYKIVLGVGSAIEYLHTGCPNPIVHRDIKPSNVMLDDEFEAKLGDFGLVRKMDPGQGSLGGTDMIGDRVYLDPVCVSKRTVSIESDVFSFGVLLLEIATGMEPAEVQGTGGLLSSNTLVNAVRESYAKGEVLGMADERLNNDFNKSQMERVLVVGLLCVQQQREDRLKIREAVNLLSDLNHPVPQILSQ